MPPILLSLTHFCDKHGPRVVLVTQCYLAEPNTSENDLLLPDYPTDSYCESCLLHFPEVSGVPGDARPVRNMRSRIKGRTFVSTQYSSIRYQLLNSITRKAFSEETMIYDCSPLVFFDDSRGLNLIIGFKLYDENARGNERRYCYILTIDTKDVYNGMNIISDNWNFINCGLKKMIDDIRQSHTQVLNERRLDAKDNGGIDGLTQFAVPYLRANKSKEAKNLVELTNDPLIFFNMHKWNSYMISSLIIRQH
ncbi:Lst7p KNAG_0D04090 [Huiozyma naganishii CBS 8797]|uniref:UDENN FLCN/SMCR8-type domain-containing protein n=1 Tax=Huiozyma naganishii (strain ATCC MYA-139 / BCRC 22969 / CBS 8797 / KCTC 17520 / NBRC 10181 / NCYC 3082 / Yp74L-3) TaxID=1071383 RepID=J7R5M3_HUIN7|nr:hypothetical protein KNAG_0D04090 [Kazachstania naganishii CBS 8797]CCK70155.1 hypothetical protein KNAG_0D04090 [Kazachstania naganishii CBS 8797]